MAKVSVILCSYNHRPYVREAVESVLAQTYTDFELIVIDNGSTDGSADILREFASDPRVRLVLHEQNTAPTKRFNEGIRLATGEYIGFLYSDDLFLPKKLQLQVDAFEHLEASYGVVTGLAERFDDSTRESWRLPPFDATGKVLSALLRDSGRLDMLSPLARRECFLRYPFYEDVFAETESAFLKLAMTYEFGFVREPVVRLRAHEANRGRAIRSNTEMSLVCLDRLVAHPDFPRECLEDAAIARRSLLRLSGWSVVRLDGDAAWARKCFRDAVRVDWREALNPRTAVGYALSFLPAKARAQLNSAGHKVTGRRDRRNLVADYGGTGTDAVNGAKS